jgi:hypothetical protein
MTICNQHLRRPSFTSILNIHRWQPKMFRYDIRDRHGRGYHSRVTSQESSHESPAGTGTDNLVAAEAAARMPVAGDENRGRGSVGDSQGHAWCTPRGNISAMLRPGTYRTQSGMQSGCTQPSASDAPFYVSSILVLHMLSCLPTHLQAKSVAFDACQKRMFCCLRFNRPLL